MAVYKKSTKAVHSAFFEFIKEYWYILAGLIVVIPYLFRFIRDQGIQDLAKQEEIDTKTNTIVNANPINEKVNRDNITKTISPTRAKIVQQVSHNVAHYLGFIYPWYDPRSWSEDDEQVYLEFKKITVSELQKVKELYYKVDAAGRNLEDDCRAVLDEKYFKLINW